MSTLALIARTGGLAAVGATFFVLGCSDSSSTPGAGTDTRGFVHQDVVLRDVLGKPIAPTSAAPYSPRATCGRCHPADEIANGYHFQQGRTDSTGKVVVADDFFGDGRKIVRSEGMYGKW